MKPSSIMLKRLHILLLAVTLWGMEAGVLSLASEAPESMCCEAHDSVAFPAIRLEPVARGLTEPLGLVHAGDGSGRLFIVEQPGTILVWEKGRARTQPFLDLRDKVVTGYEMGLLGLAFHPTFRENGRLFVNYTSRTGGLHTVIAEFQMGREADVANEATERVLLTIPQPYPNHKGGHLAFGPDGMLYIGLGDGGSSNDPQGNGQNTGTLLGKMLRIDVDKSDGGQAYGVPRDNPFVGHPLARPEIWAYGFRNPWRYSFDALTGLLYAGDVGQDDREEIDVVRRGENYGWRIMEGTICTPGVNRLCDRTGLELPIYDYPRSEGTVVIGGYVYRGKTIPELCGAYVYGDYGNGRIFGLRYDGRVVTAKQTLLETNRRISSFGEDEQHELYVVDRQGEVLKVVPANP